MSAAKTTICISVLGVLLQLQVGLGVVQAQDQPVWVEDLTLAGYSKPDDAKNLNDYLEIKHRLVFIDDKTLAVTFLGRNERLGFTMPGQPGAPYVVKTAFVDVSSGAVQKTSIWGNSGDPFDLVAVDGGRFVILDRSGITLYSQELEKVAQMKHQPDDVETEGLSSKRRKTALRVNARFLESSATGKTLVSVHSGAYVAMVRQYETSHLELLNQYKQDSFISRTVSDTQFAYTRSPKSGITLYLRPLTGKGDVRTVEVQDCDAPAFISNELLLVTGLCPSFFLIDKNGQLLAEKHLDPENETPVGMLPSKGRHVASRPLVSRNGFRFAVLESQLVPGSSWRDTFPSRKNSRLVVYDVAGLASIFSLSEPESKKGAVVGGASALSPSGALLAILRDGKLMLYSLERQ
jgi:hypothetical protein